MNTLRLEYKRETGNRPEPTDDLGLYAEEYVEWLEDKIAELQNQLSSVSIDYKAEYDDAVNEIGQLQDQLSTAEDEIRELNYEIKIRPQ